MIPRRGRISLKDQMAANQKSLDMYASAAGKPRQVLYDPPPQKQPRTIRTSAARAAVPLESDVQKAIITYLLHHPSVAWVTRINQGQAVEHSANGEARYIQFAKLYKRGCRLVDIDGQLKDGRRLAIEIKRPGWKAPHGERELEQAAFLAMVRDYGGIGLFATCIEHVTDALIGTR